MILLCGPRTDRCLAGVERALGARGAPYVWFDQSRHEDISLQFELAGGEIRGWLEIEGDRHDLDEIVGVYTRVVQIEQLPGMTTTASSAQYRRCHALHDALTNWCEVAPIRVVNRLIPQYSNSSKPYQLQLIARHGFRVPETVVTNDPEIVRDFYRQYGRVIYKSVSGIRSIVHELTLEDLLRLDLIRWCPVQFQEYVPGPNVRVHVIGDEIHTTLSETTATDYRYAAMQVGEAATMQTHALPESIALRCRSLATELGLSFAGVDLKLTPSGEWYCLEVNPSPGYIYFEEFAGVPIAASVAAFLTGD